MLYHTTHRGSFLSPGGTSEISQWRKPPVGCLMRPAPAGLSKLATASRTQAIVTSLASAQPRWGSDTYFISGGLRHRLTSDIPLGLRKSRWTINRLSKRIESPQ